MDKNIYYVNPRGSMDQLSHLEVELLTKKAKSQLYTLYRNCSLAVLNSGAVTDDSRALLNKYPDFDIHLVARERGVSLSYIILPKKHLLMIALFAVFNIICLLYCVTFYLSM